MYGVPFGIGENITLYLCGVRHRLHICICKNNYHMFMATREYLKRRNKYIKVNQHTLVNSCIHVYICSFFYIPFDKNTSFVQFSVRYSIVCLWTLYLDIWFLITPSNFSSCLNLPLITHHIPNSMLTITPIDTVYTYL